jgi:hypothetical protein
MRIIFLVIINFILLFTVCNAQSSSVYSRYGLGDIDYGYSSKMLGIGSLGVTQLDPQHIVTTNPASWSALNKTRIEFSLGYKGIRISNENASEFTSETDFKGITIGFPVSKDYGVGVVAGLLPFTTISYQTKEIYQSPDENDLPSYDVLYEGNGGLSKLFIGSSFYLPFDVTAGATLDYYFGNQRYTSSIEFVDNTTNLNTVYEEKLRSTGFGTTVGLLSPNLATELNIKSFSDIRIGLSLNYISKLKTDSLLTSTSSTQIDTLIFVNSAGTEIPLKINSGISFAFNDEYNISADYAYQAWGKFEFNGIKSENLRNSNKINFAFEYTPKYAAGMTLMNLISWRGGVSFEQTQYKFNGNGINQYSIFGGLSFPMDLDNTIDLGLQYSIRGTKEKNSLKEEFVKLYLGISFGELWFSRTER